MVRVKYRVRLNMFFITLLKIGKDHFYNFKSQMESFNIIVTIRIA